MNCAHTTFQNLIFELIEFLLTINQFVDFQISKLTVRRKKTVLVYIYGGGFAGGIATDFFHGPDFLLTADTVLVTIQYRCGIFGFLNLAYREYTGNMGLKDQQLALKWIYENIKNFSGNKDEILLFGESSGGFINQSFHLNYLN